MRETVVTQWRTFPVRWFVWVVDVVCPVFIDTVVADRVAELVFVMVSPGLCVFVEIEVVFGPL